MSITTVYIRQLRKKRGAIRLVVLDESDVRSSLSEALSADIQVVLSDEGTLVGANTAAASTLGAVLLLGVTVQQSFSSHFFCFIRLKASKKEKRNK
jgi:hypothetical protein